MFRRLLCSSVVALAIALTSSSARADEEKVVEYRELVAKGAQLFSDGDFDGARDAFRRAYRIHADPVLLFNIASTYRREGRYEQAIRLYERFLEIAEEGDQRIDLAQETIRHLELLIREREDRAKAEREAERARREQRDAEQKALAAEQERLAAEREEERRRELAEARKPKPRKKSGRMLKWGGIATAGAGVVALGFAYRDLEFSRDAADELGSLPAGTAWTLDHERKYDEGRSRRARGIGLALGGSALAAAGVVLYVAGSKRDESEPARRSIAIAPAVDGDAVGAIISGSF